MLSPSLDPLPRRTTRSILKAKATNTMDANSHASGSKFNPIPSCLHPSSAFYQVLVAPYRSSVPLPSSNFATSRRIPSLPNAGPSTSKASGSRSVSATSPTATLEYKPHGHWAWAVGMRITDTKELMQLSSNPIVSVSVNRGTLGEQQITYINKSYNGTLPIRFQSEVTLYASGDYLQRLQGDVVPNIINVDGATIAMEPPHHIFWIEASPEMPECLKQRCIQAYEKIHAQGVLHGNVELQNMLIGGNGKVTIIHFENARVLVSDDADIVPRAEFGEFAMEMREVKYKLDYDGARQKEMDKLGRSLTRQSTELMRNVHFDTFGKRSSSGVLPILMPEEDTSISPVDEQAWNKSLASLARPVRVVLPGNTDDTVSREVQSFMNLLGQTQPATSPMQSRRVRFGLSQTQFIDASPASSFASSTSSSLKRKAPEASTSANASSSKRPCYDAMEENAIGTSKDALPPIKSRDFAYEAYDGPKGYYVPCPALEATSSLNRKKYIRKQNEQRCAELGLPHPRLGRPSVGVWTSLQFERKTPRAAVALGTIKRQEREAKASQKRKLDGVESSTQKRRKLSPVREEESGSSSRRPGSDVTYGQMLASSTRPRALGENAPPTRSGTSSNRLARVEDRIVLATLGMLPRSSPTRRRTGGNSALSLRSRQPRPLSSVATDGTYYDWVYFPNQRYAESTDLDGTFYDSDSSEAALSDRSPSPVSSEDEVEEMMECSYECPPTAWTRMGSWINNLLRW